MSKNGYFLLYYNSSADDHSGVGLKIRNQIKTFNEAGLHCEEIVFPLEASKWNSLIYRLPFSNVYPRWIYRDEYDKADFLYMRRPYVMTSAMRKVLKKARKRNPKIKIIIEIPTYPYDLEFKYERFSSLLLFKDRYNRKRMKGIVDYYALIDEADTAFGLPVLMFINGIDVSSVSKRIPIATNEDDIHICAVAMFKEWHGYERVIKGIEDYYVQGGTRNIICHFVGTGKEVDKYRQLVKKAGLEEHVVFHGYLEGEKLDEVYNLCTLSLGIFGMYLKNQEMSCDLKSRDAVARGIPSVTGCMTDIFSKDRFPYFLEFPNDPSPIDISKMIEFHDRIYQNGQEKVIDAIRDYAFKTVDMKYAMKRVIDYLRG